MNKIIVISFAILCVSLGNSLFGQTEKLSKDSLLADVDVLFSSIEEIHPDMYATLSKENFNTKLAVIKSELKDEMNVFEFYKLVTPLVTAMGDGHTRINFPYSDLKNPDLLFFPFPVNIDTKDSVITIANDYTELENTIPIGATVLSINNMPIKKLVAKMMTYVSGEKDFYKLERLHYEFTPLLFIFQQADEFQIDYTYNGAKQTVLVKGIPYSERYERKAKNGGRKHYSFKELPEKNIAIIDFKGFANLEAFETFLDSSFSIIKNRKINNLIIDIRKNGGGDSKLGDELFQYISPVPFRQFGKTTIKFSDLQKDYYKSKGKSLYNKMMIWRRNGIKTINRGSRMIKLKKNDLRFDGNVYLLISHRTFSSAASFSWAFKYFEMGTVIGEESGGMAVCFGDIIHQQLPYSKINYWVSYKKFYMYGATDENNHGTIPHYIVPSENAMDYTIELIQKQK